MTASTVRPANAAALVSALRGPRAYAHDCGHVEVVETHISWVFLAGEFAYKVKKPVKLPFLDFSSLAARRFYCEEELRLNRRTAPGIYLGVVPIAGDPPSFGGEGAPIEYAVKMRRFAPGALLSEIAAAGGLTDELIDRLAARVAQMHEAAERAPADAKTESAQRALQPAIDNFTEIRGLGVDGDHRQLDVLRRWTDLEGRALGGDFADRRAAGFVRECHGDLHLGNIAAVDGEPLPFDAIEFSVRLRWGDVMSDVAFAVMDLLHHGEARRAARFLNAYLEHTGDYEGLRVLRFYLVYRAMVRAKIEIIRAGQHPPGSAAHDEALALYQRHLGLACRLCGEGSPALVVMHGPSGSGKTHVSQRLLEQLGAVRIRSDVERKRMHGLAPTQSSASAPGEGIYTQGEGRRVYTRLAELAAIGLRAGFPVVIDAACLERAQRDLFAGVAMRAHAPFRIASCAAPIAVLRARVARRESVARDASEAGLAVLDLQLAGQQPLGADEHLHAVILETSHDAAWSAGVDRLARSLRAPTEKP
jgi:aminoglycoside phosphotransferase family enzyme/predicted kinase